MIRGSSSRGGTPGPAGDVRWLPVGPLAWLDDETAVHVEVGGIGVCLARSRGAVFALLDECSHGQVALSDGEVDAGYVECWLHGSRFSLTTGRPTAPPATVPVPVYPVRIIKGVVEVALPTSQESRSSR